MTDDRPPPLRLWLSGSAEPMLLPVSALLLGVATDRQLGHYWPTHTLGRLWSAELAGFATAVALTAISVWRAWPRLGLIGLLLCALLAGAARHHQHWQRYPEDHLAHRLGGRTAVLSCTGRLLETPILRRRAPPEALTNSLHSGRQMDLLLEVESLHLPEQSISVSGRIAVTVALGEDVQPPNWFVGQSLTLTAVVSRIEPPDNPGSADWAEIHRRRRVLLRGWCETPEAVRVAGPAVRSSVSAALSAWRAAVRRPLAGAGLTDAQRDFLAALLVGDAAGLDRELAEQLRVTGTMHFVVVSGQHVALVVLAVLLVARPVLGPRWAMLPAAATLALYAAAVEPAPPVLRATVTAAILLLGWAVGGRVQMLNSLALAAGVVIWCNPTDLFDAGCQLSFLCTLALISVAPRVHTAIFGDAAVAYGQQQSYPLAEADRPAWRTWMTRATATVGDGMRAAVAANLAAWAVALPVTAHSFGLVSLMAPAVGLVAGPPLAMSIVLGFAGLMVGQVWTAGGAGLLHAAAVCGEAFAGLVAWSAQWTTLCLATPQVSAGATLAALVVVGIWMLRRRLGLPRWAVVMLLSAVLAAHLITGRLSRDREPFRLTVLSVGHGLAVVGETPCGPTWLYDAGSVRSGDVGRGVIRPFLAHRGRVVVDALLLSHPDLDHISGVPSLLSTVRADGLASSTLWDVHSTERTPATLLSRRLTVANRSVTGLARGQRLMLGPGVRGEVLWPSGDLDLDRPGLLVNDGSLVLRVVVDSGLTVLLTGDIGPGPQTLLRREPAVRADVLLMPHHGSMTGDPAAFLSAVAPRVLIISGGPARSDRLDKFLAGPSVSGAGVVVFHTHRDGAVTVLAEPDGGLTIHGYRSGRAVRLPPKYSQPIEHSRGRSWNPSCDALVEPTQGALAEPLRTGSADRFEVRSAGRGPVTTDASASGAPAAPPNRGADDSALL